MRCCRFSTSRRFHGDFQDALAAILGADAPNLSGVISRLTDEWEADYARWQRRDLSARRYVYIWADGVYPWLPVHLLLRHRMNVADAVARSSAKIAIIAAEQDEIVPPRRTEALRRSAKDVALNRVIEGVGHNDIYDSEGFVAAMGTALRLIEEQTEPRE